MRKVDRQAYMESMKEIDIHKMLNHPNIVRLYETIDDKDDDKVYLIMEYAEKGQILTHDRKTNQFKPAMSHGVEILPEKDVRRFSK